MVLTAISTSQPIGIPGQLVGPSHLHRIRTGKNTKANVAKVLDVTLTPQNAHDYTLTINGIEVTVTSANPFVAADTLDEFVAAIAASSYINTKLGAENVADTTLRLTELTPEDGEVEVLEADANIAIAEATAHGEEEPMPAGVVVAQGDSTDQITTLRANTDVIAGVAVHGHAQVNEEGLTGADLYPPNSVLGVLQGGPMLVRTEDDDAANVAQGLPLYARFTASGTNTILGACRTDDDGGNAVLIAGARFESAASGGAAEATFNIP